MLSRSWAESDLRGGRNRVGLTSGAAKLMEGGRVGSCKGPSFLLCRCRAGTVSAVGRHARGLEGWRVR